MASELTMALLRKSVRKLSSELERCRDCDRAPLAGELMHELDGGHQVCDLCLKRLPAEEQDAARSRRVGATAQRLVVSVRAA